MLPFKLTEAQRRVVKEIFKDLQSDAPMNRLLQGDVGSGKDHRSSDCDAGGDGKWLSNRPDGAH